MLSSQPEHCSSEALGVEQIYVSGRSCEVPVADNARCSREQDEYQPRNEQVQDSSLRHVWRELESAGLSYGGNAYAEMNARTPESSSAWAAATEEKLSLLRPRQGKDAQATESAPQEEGLQALHDAGDTIAQWQESINLRSDTKYW